jgi:hypothetical protein
MLDLPGPRLTPLGREQMPVGSIMIAPSTNPHQRIVWEYAVVGTRGWIWSFKDTPEEATTAALQWLESLSKEQQRQ